MISVQTTIKGDTAKMLQTLSSELGPAGKAKLNEAATHPVAVLIRGHILQASQTRHTTADEIRNGPATRTGHLTKAAESVSETFDSESGQIGISSPGFRRALGPLVIRVRHKQFLTIPVNAASYGETVTTLRYKGINVFRRKDYLAARIDGVFRVLYLLRTEVRLPHDPGLLPEHERMGDAAKNGLKILISRIIGATA